jgi:hypothetical protein
MCKARGLSYNTAQVFRPTSAMQYNNNLRMKRMRMKRKFPVEIPTYIILKSGFAVPKHILGVSKTTQCFFYTGCKATGWSYDLDLSPDLYPAIQQQLPMEERAEGKKKAEPASLDQVSILGPGSEPRLSQYRQCRQSGSTCSYNDHSLLSAKQEACRTSRLCLFDQLL